MTSDGAVVVVDEVVVVMTTVVDVDEVVELVDEDVDAGDVDVVTEVTVGWLVLDGSDEPVCVLEAQANSNGGAKTMNHNDRREVMRQ
jgi:hypothetical protein